MVESPVIVLFFYVASNQ